MGNEHPFGVSACEAAGELNGGRVWADALLTRRTRVALFREKDGVLITGGRWL